MHVSKVNLLAEAVKRVDAFDEIDRKAGAATPQQAGIREVLETIHAACGAALSCFERGDEQTGLSCVADCVVMASRALGVEVS